MIPNGVTIALQHKHPRPFARDETLRRLIERATETVVRVGLKDRKAHMDK